MNGERLYHILIWTGDGSDFFIEKKQDRIRFLKVLRKARKSGGFHVYAYCLMRDRLQFLCSCPPGMIEKILASVEGVYRNYCQGKYRDKAPVWEHGVYECGWEGLLDLVRYIHRAPLRAEKRKGLSYRWSSHVEYAAEDDRWVDLDALQVYGKKSGDALARYRRFVRRPSADRPVSVFYLAEIETQEAAPAAETAVAEDARAETWEPYESAVVVDKDAAESAPAAADEAADKPQVSGKDTEEANGICPEKVIAVTAQLMGVTPASMQKGGGVPQETAARRVALYILKEDVHLSNAETGRTLGMAASTVSRWYNNAQRREDLISRIERVRRQLIK